MPSYVTEPIAGAYNLTYASADSPSNFLTLGVVGDRCLKEVVQYAGQDITGHALGPQTVIDGIYLGGNCFLEFVCQEYNRNIVKSLIHPFSIASGSSFVNTPGLDGEIGVSGTLMSQYAGILKATPITNTLAHQKYSASLRVRTYGIAVVANGHSIERFFEAQLQAIPMRLRCYPYDFNGKQVWYTKAAS